MMLPDSKTRVGGEVEWSTMHGIFELGLTATKPEPNCSPPMGMRLGRQHAGSGFGQLALRRVRLAPDMLQAAPGSGQPRLISRLGCAGRPYRPCFDMALRHAL